MKVAISTYWKCQLIGWGAWFLFDYLLLRLPFMTSLLASIFGLAVTHFLRYLIKQFKIFTKTTVTQIVYLLLLNSILAFFGTWFLVWVLDVTGVLYKNLPPNSFRPPFWGEVFWGYHQALSAGTAWTAIYFAVHYIRDLKKTEQEKNDLRISLAESETMALRAQMNPQFIFNGMNSIRSLVTKNENDKAAHYLTTFSKLIRTLFQNADKRKVSLFEEVETCKLYTQLEKMNGANEVEFIFNVEETIDLKDFKVPALAIQSTIEKAIWYGLTPENTERRIVISVTENDGGVQCIIDDNGVSRELSKQYKMQYEANRHSKGIGLTQTRVDLDKLLNEREDSITIIDQKNDSGGTKVIISIKENRN